MKFILKSIEDWLLMDQKYWSHGEMISEAQKYGAKFICWSYWSGTDDEDYFWIIAKWLDKERIKTKRYKNGSEFYWYFRNIDDALLFKLTWL